MKVMILDTYSSYHRMFENEGWEITSSPNEADLICFTGGNDVDPSLYGQTMHPYTSSPDKERDAYEAEVFFSCKRRGTPMVGICRGAQFLHVMNGGTLIQHVNNHASKPHHPLITIDWYDKDIEVVTSSHHQMMDIRETNGELLAYSERRGTIYEGDDGVAVKPDWMDAEVVWHEKSKCLCHQPHPEWMDNNAPYVQYFWYTVNKYCLGEEDESKNSSV